MNYCYSCFHKKDDEQNVCSSCGYTNKAVPDNPVHLVEGTILNGQYLIGKVIGHGGFGITYLALDLALETKVAIKEYFPNDIATRTTESSTVLPMKTNESEETYVYGRDKFMEEAKTMAKFTHFNSIVRVLSFFVDNNTAYIVMEYLEGEDLLQYVKGKGGRIETSEALKLLEPVFDCLIEMHKHGILHRDISPDNIYITKHGKVKLLDFGASRFAISEKSKSLSVILKPGYAPPEQYSSRGKQGTWTDVYALAATLYRIIMGRAPVEAVDRQMDDSDFVNEAKLLPDKVRNTIIDALVLLPDKRIQAVSEFKKELYQDNQKLLLADQRKNQLESRVNSNDNGSGTSLTSNKKESSSAKRERIGVTIFFGIFIVILIGLLLMNGLASHYDNPDNDIELIEEENQSNEADNGDLIEVTELGLDDIEFSYEANSGLVFFIKTEYEYVNLYVNDKLYDIDNIHGMVAEFYGYKAFSIDDNFNDSLVDIKIEVLDENNRIREKIEVLDFYMAVSSNLSKLENVERIQYLSIQSEDIDQDINILNSFINLKSVEISSANNITGDLSVFTNLDYLKALKLDSCSNITGDLYVLSELINLEVLELEYCSGVTGNLSYLEDMSNLKALTLVDLVNVTGDSYVLSKLTNLEVLHLESCSGITGDLSSLKGMNNLKNLWLYDLINITGDLHALSELTNLRVLMLSDLNIKGNLQSLSSLTNLNVLVLTDFSESLEDDKKYGVEGDLRDLGNLTQLKVLGLYLRRITGDIAELEEMSKLELLSVYGCNNLTGNINSLKSLNKLTFIYFEECPNITGDLSSLSALNEIEQIYVYDCPLITGTLTLRDGSEVTANE